jgi:hypothetical protein
MRLEVCSRHGGNGSPQPRIEHQTLSTCFHEAPEGRHRRVATTMLISRNDWLGGASTPCELGLRQSASAPDRDKKCCRIHGVSISDCLWSLPG